MKLLVEVTVDIPENGRRPKPSLILEFVAVHFRNFKHRQVAFVYEYGLRNPHEAHKGHHVGYEIPDSVFCR